MRITYRKLGVKDYWEKRWSEIPADLPMSNKLIYPLKYSEMMLQDGRGRILEAGCGAGRLLRHYANEGWDIIGIDYVESAIKKLKSIDPEIKAEIGDITKLNYPNESFKYVFAFGLYHNLEKNLKHGVQETYRVMQKGGLLCASFRADNLQTKLVDLIFEMYSKKDKEIKKFHKQNLTANEFCQLFKSVNMKIEFIGPVVNMPIMYKFKFFRAKRHKFFNENIARSEGYLLTPFGNLIQNILMHVAPNQFCNLYVLIARK
jgi:ubiquinone/menaquinone biosynthesis C-methylase UbiE